jgi:serine/threonine protein kinase
MNVKEVYEKLVGARRPIDFFGDVSPDKIRSHYLKCAKIVHPDKVGEAERYIAGEAMAILNRIYNRALVELENGIYNIVKPIDLYALSEPLFQLDIGRRTLKFYEHFFVGEVADVFKGTDDTNIVFLKVATDSADNDLVAREFKLLERLRHQSLPIVEDQIIINDKSAFVMREAEGTPLPDLLRQYPQGIPAEHVMWMLERLLSVVGYLHSQNIVHGNLKPEHIVINRDNHNVSILGFSFCITEANKKTAHYRIVNDVYTPPEVNESAQVLPNADIYAIGKLAILMLGGRVSNNALPVKIDGRVRAFIRHMVDDSRNRPNDAWQLWDELITLRTKVYGAARFQEFE